MGIQYRNVYTVKNAGSQKLLSLDNLISAVAFQLQAVIQETHKLPGATTQHLPATGWPGACLHLSLYSKHRPKAFKFLFAHIQKRDCL